MCGQQPQSGPVWGDRFSTGAELHNKVDACARRPAETDRCGDAPERSLRFLWETNVSQPHGHEMGFSPTHSAMVGSRPVRRLRRTVTFELLNDLPTCSRGRVSHCFVLRFESGNVSAESRANAVSD